MDINVAKTKIISHKNKLEQEKIDKEISYKIEQENLIEEIEQLKPRIEKIIEIGNFCIENNINLNSINCKCKYDNDAFETDGIYHQLGFYRNNYEGHPKYQCTHYDYIGYEMGGVCGNINFITNGDIIASTPDYNGFEIKSLSEPLVKHMKMFLRDFPTFEKVFYNFIDNL